MHDTSFCILEDWYKHIFWTLSSEDKHIFWTLLNCSRSCFSVLELMRHCRNWSQILAYAAIPGFWKTDSARCLLTLEIFGWVYLLLTPIQELTNLLTAEGKKNSVVFIELCNLYYKMHFSICTTKCLSFFCVSDNMIQTFQHHLTPRTVPIM